MQMHNKFLWVFLSLNVSESYVEKKKTYILEGE